MKIGFIGLGLMGSRMVKHLLGGEHEVIVWNRSDGKMKPFEGKAKMAESPQALAQESDIVFTMLSDPKAVEAVAFGEDGFIDSMKDNALWVNNSTVNPSFAMRMGEKAKDHNVRYLDAPVAGSTPPADKGELVFLVGGSEGDLNEAKPFIDKMGKAINHVGEIGKGSAMKMLINTMLGANMAVFAEILNLGEAMGITKEKVMDSIMGGPVAAPFLALKKDKLQKQEFEVEFPLKLMQKDLKLVSETAFENNIAMPSTNAIKELYALANQKGWGEEDFSAVYGYIKGEN